MTTRPRVIALWSAPRSRSTAFLRMMMERGDLTTLHEPFSHRSDFGSTEVAGRTVTTEPDLIEAIRELALTAPVFFKDTTDFRFPGVLADPRFLAEVRHTFIIRRPDEVIASHYALDPEVTADGIGFGRLHELFEAVRTATGTTPAVVDSDDLLDDPAATVRLYCESVGLPFRADTLTWASGMREEWQKASKWHADAGRSGGFTRTERTYEFTVDNHPVLAEHHRRQKPYYDDLYRHRLPVHA
ncbi:sulfotransferase family protein [Streptomyces sp. NBC_01497]|uniref:sulfotransferase-like domain-containing protein n=1 Tax=Streptomyces sp. NBC_01497 TaxID=2903885 RepID=UPI002E332610|nr:sulfotransferase family protein [Streptomyces sp. NBC_01497]